MPLEGKIDNNIVLDKLQIATTSHCDNRKHVKRITCNKNDQQQHWNEEGVMAKKRQPKNVIAEKTQLFYQIE